MRMRLHLLVWDKLFVLAIYTTPFVSRHSWSWRFVSFVCSDTALLGNNRQADAVDRCWHQRLSQCVLVPAEAVHSFSPMSCCSKPLLCSLCFTASNDSDTPCHCQVRSRLQDYPYQWSSLLMRMLKKRVACAERSIERLGRFKCFLVGASC